MTKISRIVTVALMAAAAAVTGAQAADIDLPVVVDQAPEFVPVEVGSGWYLRGDIGYTVESSSDIFGYRTTASDAIGDYYDTADISSEWGGGIGVGYTFNPWLRADLTAEIFKGSFEGTTSAAAIAGVDAGCGIGLPCASNDIANFTAYSFMANAYVDLGTFKHFTPYVGAGAGVTNVRWEDMTNANYCPQTDPACAGITTTTASVHPGLSDWRLTWALMAGASYQMTQNTKLDVGYRFRHVEGGDFFGFPANATPAGATGAQAADEGFNTHEIRAGIRYELW